MTSSSSRLIFLKLHHHITVDVKFILMQSDRCEETAVSCNETFLSVNHIAAIFNSMNLSLLIFIKDECFESMS